MTTDPRQLVEQVLVVIGAMTGTPLEIHGTDADLEEAARVALLSSLTPRLVEALVEALDERDELRLTLAAEQGLEEGLPVGWHVTTRDGYGRPTCFAFTARPTLIVFKLAPADGPGWAWFYQGSLVNRTDRAATARATMLAAAAATVKP